MAESPRELVVVITHGVKLHRKLTPWLIACKHLTLLANLHPRGS
jgi:hypothetical protein